MLLPWQSSQWQVWRQQQDRLGHAYLLTGNQGIGLPEFARAMAKGLLCQQPGLEPCNQCNQCHQFDQHTHPDFFPLAVLEDKKDISVDQVRELSDKVFSTSHQGGFKVAWVNQAEKLSQSAFNALLKTLEEPPAETVLILTSYTPNRLPATIVSRCRRLEFVTPDKQTALTWLQGVLPQADEPLLKKALRVNWGAPLSARDWIEAKQFEFEATWQADLQAMVQQEATITEVVAKWLKHEAPQQVFDYFYLWTVSRIRAACYQQQQPLQMGWMNFQKTLLNAKQAWQQNANKELLLESLCLSWLESLQEHDKTAENKVSKMLPTGLKGSLIRGEQI